ncbi:hypothetical protein [Giesbergeria anulus]|uniref:Carbon storage regulator, CsrA n=1 Tax=Giesbergeria anulus TaxID=180197 RepID=A0A1H9E739_9BURK|nr:hypothetical protein [Giesbergeria anulus]SEQ20708.1 hypothetical protein SAMN02982919_00200 [Giesbergeria anulus]
MSDLSAATIDLRPGEALEILGVRVEFVHKSGQRSRVRVLAPRDVQIKKYLPDSSTGVSEDPPSMVSLQLQ